MDKVALLNELYIHYWSPTSKNLFPLSSFERYIYDIRVMRLYLVIDMFINYPIFFFY